MHSVPCSFHLCDLIETFSQLLLLTAFIYTHSVVAKRSLSAPKGSASRPGISFIATNPSISRRPSCPQMTADLMDADRLREAMLIILSSLSSTKNDPDDLAEIVDFLVSETQESNVDLPLLEPSSLSKATPAPRSLEELDSMPIVSILGPHLVDLLDVSPQHVPIVIDEILDHYVRGPPTALDTEDFQKAKDRLCELCERPATLTEHHLIPRSEHDLFVKRGVFTIEECG